MSLPYNQKIIPLAKHLRKNATPQENHLWYDFLSSYKIRFQRQKTIGDYIADFYCDKVGLIIEIDGSQHYTENGKEKDKLRTEVLEKQGLSVLRFSNQDINTKFYDVCIKIDETVTKMLQST